MPDVHSLLSASSSKRWLNCPPCARLEENFPNKTSVFAEEGTFAHSVCEYKVKKYLHERVRRPQSEEYYSEELEQTTDIYYEFVVSAIEEMKHNGCEPLVLVEERVDYSHIAPSGFGTADMVIIGHDADGAGILHVIDYKHGKGVFVDCDHNSQMMLYAIGALHAYGYIYQIATVRMTIVQPRMDNISTFECSREELESWGESIRPIAWMAFEGKGKQKAGDWCHFCRARPVCQACRDEALALCRDEFLDLDADSNDVLLGDIRASPETSAEPAAASEPETASEPVTTSALAKQETATALTTSPPVFRQPGLIPLSELAAILPTLNRIGSWIEAVFTYVSAEAINHAVPIPGYKIVEGRSMRVFTDTNAVVETAVKNGYTDLYKQTLITLTEFEKMMGKKRFQELLGEYVTKPPGKLTLVPDDDPRPPAELTADAGQYAENEFAVLTDD